MSLQDDDLDTGRNGSGRDSVSQVAHHRFGALRKNCSANAVTETQPTDRESRSCFMSCARFDESISGITTSLIQKEVKHRIRSKVVELHAFPALQFAVNNFQQLPDLIF